MGCSLFPGLYSFVDLQLMGSYYMPGMTLNIILIIFSLHYDQMWKIFLSFPFYTCGNRGPGVSNRPVLPKPEPLA